LPIREVDKSAFGNADLVFEGYYVIMSVNQVTVTSLMGRSRKDPYSPHRGNFCRPEGEGRKTCSDNSKCVRTSKGGRGLTSYFLRGGGMDVFWNDPI
jgi:hypothetical protein